MPETSRIRSVPLHSFQHGAGLRPQWHLPSAFPIRDHHREGGALDSTQSWKLPLPLLLTFHLLPQALQASSLSFPSSFQLALSLIVVKITPSSSQPRLVQHNLPASCLRPLLLFQHSLQVVRPLAIEYSVSSCLLVCIVRQVSIQTRCPSIYLARSSSL